MSKLRFCFLSTFYPPFNFGGDGIFIQRLARALAAQDHDVHVVHSPDAFLSAGGRPEPAAPDPSVTVHSLTAGHLANVDLLANHQGGRPWLFSKRLNEILNDNFDVIHFHNVSLIGGPSILSMGRGLKLCTLHDYWFVCPTHVLWRYNREPCTKRTCFSCTLSYKRPPQLWRSGNLIEKAAEHVDHFLAPSASSIRLHHANGFPKPIVLLPHFVPRPSYLSHEPKIFSKLKNKQYFLFSGRLEKIKGVDILIDAFRSYTHADLIIAGAGNHEHHLRHHAADLDHIHFLGNIDATYLNSLYKNAIATITPFLTYETFGLVIAESFANKTPVIAHKIGALPEILADGGGLLYEQRHELLEHLKAIQFDEELRARLSDEAIAAYSNNYTEEIHMSRYLDLVRAKSKTKALSTD